MLQKELKDPRLGFITITGAEITRDLRNAKVYVSVLGSEDEQKKSMIALQRAAGFISGEFTRRNHLRVAPEILFQADIGISRGSRIFELLGQIEREPKSEDVEPATEAA